MTVNILSLFNPVKQLNQINKDQNRFIFYRGFKLNSNTFQKLEHRPPPVKVFNLFGTGHPLKWGGLSHQLPCIPFLISVK